MAEKNIYDVEIISINLQEKKQFHKEENLKGEIYISRLGLFHIMWLQFKSIFISINGEYKITRSHLQNSHKAKKHRVATYLRNTCH